MYLMSNYGYRNEKDETNAEIVAVDAGSFYEPRRIEYKRFLFDLMFPGSRRDRFLATGFLGEYKIIYSPLNKARPEVGPQPIRSA